jgi:hypothetical protein
MNDKDMKCMPSAIVTLDVDVSDAVWPRVAFPKTRGAEITGDAGTSGVDALSIE